MTRESAIQVLTEEDRFTPEQVREYVDEAEHQDGEGYWNQFTDPDSLKDDVRLYFEMAEIAKTEPDAEA
jgi:hypothetical protein